VPGVERVEQVNIALGDTSYFFVTYRGDLGTLRSILTARGWGADITGGQLRVYVRAPAPATPAPQPSPPASNTTGTATQDRSGAAAPVQAQGAGQ
jgi:hypothetical protein